MNSMHTSMTNYFSNVSLMFVFVIPILTMRLFSEERKNKTDQLLLTAPIKVTDIVLGKFLAAGTVLLIGTVITTLFLPIMNFYGSPDIAESLIGYLGIFLLGLLFVSLGMFLSSITESQVIAAISTLVVIFFLWFVGNMNLQFSTILTGIFSWLGAFLDWFMNFISINNRLYDFTLGTLNIVPLFYFISLTALFVFLTVSVIERRRWK